MPANLHKITLDDVLPPEVYARERAEYRKRLIEVKRKRRVSVGPYITFYFENYETMWQQVQEMVHIEKGNIEQAKDEIAIYNPLIPQGRELIATLMIEIADPKRRDQELYQLTGIEENVYLDLGGTKVRATPTDYTERTTPDGKTSSVHWVRLALKPEEVSMFKSGLGEVTLGLTHPHYRHTTVLSLEAREALGEDFD